MTYYAEYIEEDLGVTVTVNNQAVDASELGNHLLDPLFGQDRGQALGI